MLHGSRELCVVWCRITVGGMLSALCVGIREQAWYNVDIVCLVLNSEIYRVNNRLLIYDLASTTLWLLSVVRWCWNRESGRARERERAVLMALGNQWKWKRGDVRTRETRYENGMSEDMTWRKGGWETEEKQIRIHIGVMVDLEGGFGHLNTCG